MFFSIIIVCLNAKEMLAGTIASIFEQTYDYYEIIIKDGMSTDGTASILPCSEKIKWIVKKDKGIYDAMNQGLESAQGDFVFFLNAGDSFYDANVLANVANLIKNRNVCYYGDYYNLAKGCLFKQDTQISDYFWYRGTICHQTVFFPVSLFKTIKYADNLKIAADFKLLLLLYLNEIEFKHMDIIIAKYDGNGISESKEGRRCGKYERHLILKENYSLLKRIAFFVNRCFLKIRRLFSGIAMTKVQNKDVE